MINVLFIGDIVGRPGREAVSKVLPGLKKKYKVDLVLANGENLAHGSGMTVKTIEEMKEAGVDFFTSGNHLVQQKEAVDLLDNPKSSVIRPLNYPPGVPGQGSQILSLRTSRILVINLMGRVFMHENFDDPFRAFDFELKKNKGNYDTVIVDFHAEATSETVAFKHYVDGRAALLVGTHTHVPTADAQVTEKGLAYITDIGMVGAHDSILGVDKDVILENFKKQIRVRHEISETDKADFAAVRVKIEPGKNKAREIELIQQIVDI